ncbi:(+)-larreatricin hydroxylase chloroplastic, partial [Bienertia sinuspersici]
MASLSTTTTPTTTTTTTTKSLSSTSHNPLWSKPSQLSAFRSNQTRHIAPKISCKVTTNVETSKFDRRNMLIGLGGLYGAATTLSGGSAAIAKPTAPDVTECGLSEADDGHGNNPITLDCCPSGFGQAVDFKLPNPYSEPRKVNIRPAAHLVNNDYIQKYWKALALMKALPDSDPRSFKQQADVHCAYCNGGYHQVGLPDLDYQIHASWLFFPFHRAYLYFYEK